MLPPPITIATSTPRPWTSRISSAMRWMTAGSRPNWRGPMRASPLSFRRILRYLGSLPTPAPDCAARRSARGADRILACPVLAEDEAREPLHPDVLPRLADHAADSILDRDVRIAHERLLHQAELLIELLHLAGDDLLDHRLRLPGGPRLLPVDLLLLPQDLLGHLVARDEARLGGGDMHRQILHQSLEVPGARHEIGLAVHLDQHPDAPARMDVGADRALGRRLGGALGRRRLAALPEDLVSGLEVAPGLDEGRLAIHHRSAATLAELLHLRCADFHVSSSPVS